MSSPLATIMLMVVMVTTVVDGQVGCPNIVPMSNFDLTRLPLTLYMVQTSSNDDGSPPIAKCFEETLQLTTDGGFHITVNSKSTIGNIPASITYFATRTGTQPSEFTYTLIANYNVRFDQTIIAADYHNYAIFARCVMDENNNYSTKVDIHSPQKALSDSATAQVQNILQTAGISTNLSVLEETNC